MTDPQRLYDQLLRRIEACSYRGLVFDQGCGCVGPLARCHAGKSTKSDLSVTTHECLKCLRDQMNEQQQSEPVTEPTFQELSKQMQALKVKRSDAEKARRLADSEVSRCTLAQREIVRLMRPQLAKGPKPTAEGLWFLGPGGEVQVQEQNAPAPKTIDLEQADTPGDSPAL